jgi:hypothetical protein
MPARRGKSRDGDGDHCTRADAPGPRRPSADATIPFKLRRVAWKKRVSEGSCRAKRQGADREPVMSGSKRPRRARVSCASLAPAALIAGLAVFGQAVAQGRHPPDDYERDRLTVESARDISPRRIVPILARHGHRLAGPIRSRGEQVIVTGVDARGEMMRFIIDPDEGEVLSSWPVASAFAHDESRGRARSRRFAPPGVDDPDDYGPRAFRARDLEGPLLRDYPGLFGRSSVNAASDRGRKPPPRTLPQAAPSQAAKTDPGAPAQPQSLTPPSSPAEASSGSAATNETGTKSNLEK